jgi:hypothetical protein
MSECKESRQQACFRLRLKMKNTSPKLNKVMAAGSGAGVGEKLI